MVFQRKENKNIENENTMISKGNFNRQTQSSIRIVKQRTNQQIKWLNRNTSKESQKNKQITTHQQNKSIKTNANARHTQLSSNPISNA